MTSRLNNLEDSITNLPSADTSKIVERIKAIEVSTEFNERKLEKIDADIDKIVEHVDSSFRKITDTMNSNPLSLGN
tara:strand:- start:3339 stop:3566 length:228 start_codon:yes stop_codon:yes gene_type:complete